MRYVKFTIEANDEFGINGIVPKIFKNWTNYLPSLGLGLAHDLLEHGTKETGGIDEEFAALGSLCYVRDFGNFTDMGFFYPFHVSLASGISRQCEESTCEVRPSPKIYGLTKSEKSKLSEFCVDFRNALIQDWKSYNFDYDGQSSIYDCPFIYDSIWNHLRDWMFYGYARAKKRYPEPYNAFLLFSSIETETQNLGLLEEYTGTGVEFTLELDLDNSTCKITHPYLI